MQQLRKTRRALWRTSRFAGGLMVPLALLVLSGCGTCPLPTDDAPSPTGSPGPDDPVWLTSRGHLPAPDAERIEYDSRGRLLKFHDLPAGYRWMVRLPGEKNGRLVGPLHHLPEGVDLEETLVYYTRHGAKSSTPVTVAQIESGRVPHSSLARVP